MFGKYFNACMAVAENLSGAHNYWIADSNLSYITLNSGELVFTSNQEKFQVLARPSVKWNESHLIDLDKTAKALAMEILKQVGEYKREGKAIISAERWLADLNAFESKNHQWDKGLWIDDIEKLEIEKWADFLGTQENPIFQDLADFLKCHLIDYKEAESDQSQPHFRELLKSEIDAAYKLADFLTSHSNDILREGADWIPQWMESH